MRYKAVEKLIPILAKEYNLTEYVPIAMNLLKGLQYRYWAIMKPSDYEGALALLYLASSIKDPLKIYEVKEAGVMDAIREFAKKLDIPLRSVASPSLFARFMGEPDEVVEIVRQLEEKDLPHASIQVKTATLVYLAYKMLGRNVFQKNIAKLYKVNPMSIMRYKKILKEKKIIDF